jgi:hypothetical protein
VLTHRLILAATMLCLNDAYAELASSCGRRHAHHVDSDNDASLALTIEHSCHPQESSTARHHNLLAVDACSSTARIAVHVTHLSTSLDVTTAMRGV